MLFFLSRASLQYDDRLPLQENHTLRSGQHRLGGSMPFPFFRQALMEAGGMSIDQKEGCHVSLSYRSTYVRSMV